MNANNDKENNNNNREEDRNVESLNSQLPDTVITPCFDVFKKRISRVLIISCVNGSLGDIKPMLQLAKSIAQMEPSWTKICIIVNEYFESACDDLQLKDENNVEVHLIASKSCSYLDILSRDRKTSKSVFDYFLSTTVEHYRVLKSISASFENVLVCGIPLDFACKLLQEEAKMKDVDSNNTFEFVTILLTPALLRSSDVVHHPVTGLACTSQFDFKLNDWFIDFRLAKSIDKIRKQIGIIVVRDDARRFKTSTFTDFLFLEKSICLFPQWFHTHEIPSKYPSMMKSLHLSQTNFPTAAVAFGSNNNEEKLSEDLLESIEENIFSRFFSRDCDSPTSEPTTILVCVSASGNPEISSKYFKQIIDAAMSRRETVACILLTKFPNRLPELKYQSNVENKENVFHIDFCPLPALLTYLSKERGTNVIVVNHATIGVCKTALALSIPQILIPLSFDQPDNARRLVELKVALSCSIKTFSKKKFLHMIDQIEKNRRVFELNCERVHSEEILSSSSSTSSSLAEAADILIELLFGKRGWNHQLGLRKQKKNTIT